VLHTSGPVLRGHQGDLREVRRGAHSRLPLLALGSRQTNCRLSLSPSPTAGCPLRDQDQGTLLFHLSILLQTSQIWLCLMGWGAIGILQDNVFVTVVASVQYRALADKASDAFYKLSNTREQIQSYVFDGTLSLSFSSSSLCLALPTGRF
jgi:hypothetical protein